MPTLGVEIRRLMVVKGLTQQQVADAVGCRQSFISGLVTGKKTGVGAQVLYRLCDVLGVGCEHFKQYFPTELTSKPVAKKLGKTTTKRG